MFLISLEFDISIYLNLDLIVTDNITVVVYIRAYLAGVIFHKFKSLLIDTSQTGQNSADKR